jgi:hypothetical protein
MENLNEEVHKAYEVIKKAESSCILQIPSGNWMMRQILRLLPKYINSNKEPKEYDCFDEWRTHDVQRL